MHKVVFLTNVILTIVTQKVVIRTNVIQRVIIQIAVQQAPLNGITDNGIDWLMRSNLSRLNKLVFHTYFQFEANSPIIITPSTDCDKNGYNDADASTDVELLRNYAFNMPTSQLGIYRNASVVSDAKTCATIGK